MLGSKAVDRQRSGITRCTVGYSSPRSSLKRPESPIRRATCKLNSSDLLPRSCKGLQQPKQLQEALPLLLLSSSFLKPLPSRLCTLLARPNDAFSQEANLRV